MSYTSPDDNLDLSSLPALPELARDFIQLQHKPQIDAQDIQPLLESCPQLSGQLLGIINSDHFNMTTRVDSLQQAIELAGMPRVANLFQILVMYRIFNAIRIRGVERPAFWQDVLRRAVTARLLGEQLQLDASRCFCAGFMQELGLYLLLVLKPKWGQLWTELRLREPNARYQMEQDTFGMSHDQMLDILCRQWGIAEDLTQPLIHHHHCAESSLPHTQHALCQVLHVTDWLASVYTANDKNFVLARSRELLQKTFDLPAERCEDLLAALPDAVNLAAAVLDIDIETHSEFSQVLYQANEELSADNVNFQELAYRLEQALQERDRLAAELNRELDLAREIQRSLLPADMGEDFPLAGINISARDLSGDFYDYFSLPDGRIYFNLGDVSGKGVNAALLMAKTSSLFRGLGKRIDSPGELLAQLNIELCETSIHGMFVAMVAGIYCPRSGSLRLVNAGSPPALLVSGEGLAREIEAMAPPLGVLEIAEFPEIEVQLDDNSLYMFSDGLTEAHTGDGNMLGLSGLFRIIAAMPEGLTAMQRIEYIVNSIRHTDQRNRDDMTLLLLDDSSRNHAAT